jgi:hypothetical protein
MLAHVELRNQLIRFLNDELSLEDFEDWFVQNSWNVHKIPDLVLQRLVYAVELRLAEMSSEHLSEDEFRRELADLVKVYSMNISQEPSSVITGNCGSFSFQQWSVPSFGMQLAGAFGSQVPD